MRFDPRIRYLLRAIAAHTRASYDCYDDLGEIGAELQQDIQDGFDDPQVALVWASLPKATQRRIIGHVLDRIERECEQIAARKQ